MKVQNYIDKYGVIYGVSSRYEFGWKHSVYRFTSMEKATEWLHTETYSFAERELCSRSRAIELAGREAVDDIDALYKDKSN